MEEKKNVSKRRFGEFVKERGWKSEYFENLAEIVRGASPRPIQDPKWFDKNSQVGWLRISDVTEQNGRIRYLEQHISELGQKKTRVIHIPHLLLSIAATVGKPVINYTSTGVHDGFLIFYEPKFDIEYMYYWLEKFRPEWSKYGQPGSQVNLNSELVKTQKVYLPSKSEQLKIKKFFQHLDKLIDVHQQKLQKLKAQKQAYLSEMFPQEGETKPKRRFAGFDGEWEEFTLGELGSVASCKRIYKNQTTEIGEIPFYKIGTFGKKADSYISKKLFEEYKSKFSYPKKGDLLLSASGSIGQVIEYQGEEAYFQDSNIVWLALDARVSNLFLKQFYSIVHWFGLEGSTIKRLYNKNILNTKIILPEYNEQQKIGSFFQKLDSLIEKQEERVKKYQALKQAYLNEMFV